jgi:catechol 2,3-dioxygenase-like lactoylglutathione lyase family enzyme
MFRQFGYGNSRFSKPPKFSKTSPPKFDKNAGIPWLTLNPIKYIIAFKDNVIDHVILTVSDFKRSVAFYVKALKPLGITAFIDYEGKDGHPDLKGFGDGKRYFFWLKEGKPDPQAVHVGFVAKDHSEVDAFYKAALAAGGKSKESPQARLEYYPGYYATWVLDPDGHDIEVVNKS